MCCCVSTMELSPKEIVAKDAVSALIENLGLNEKKQKLGFRGPKLTIAEKFAVTKRKEDICPSGWGLERIVGLFSSQSMVEKDKADNCYFTRKDQVDGVCTCRYAYSEKTGDNFNEEGVSLTGPALKVRGDTAAMREFNYGLAEDLEEDKRE